MEAWYHRDLVYTYPQEIGFTCREPVVYITLAHQPPRYGNSGQQPVRISYDSQGTATSTATQVFFFPPKRF